MSLDFNPIPNGVLTVLFLPGKGGVSVLIGSGLHDKETWSGDQEGQLILLMSTVCSGEVGGARVVEVGLWR